MALVGSGLILFSILLFDLFVLWQQRRDSCRRGEDVPAAPVQEKIGHSTIFKLYLHKSEVDPQAIGAVSQVGADGFEDDGEKEEAVEKGDGGVEHQHSALLLLPVLHRALVVVVVVGEQTKPIHVGLGGCQSRLIGKESWAFKSSKRKWRPIEQII